MNSNRRVFGAENESRTFDFVGRARSFVRSFSLRTRKTFCTRTLVYDYLFVKANLLISIVVRKYVFLQSTI